MKEDSEDVVAHVLRYTRFDILYEVLIRAQRRKSGNPGVGYLPYACGIDSCSQ